MATLPAHAGPLPFNLGDELFPHAPKGPAVGLYQDNGTDPPFVLDRSTTLVLMRFDQSNEVWLLTAQPAPRGDMIYRNDAGEPMLRATRLGGMTLFTLDHPEGTPVAFVGDAAPLRPSPPVTTPAALLQRLAQASAHASHAVQRLIVFEARDVTPQSATLIADAAGVTSEAIVSITRRADGRKVLARLAKVLLSPGHKASVDLVNGVLLVVVAPRNAPGFADIAGRPSSRRIELAFDR
ncbi:MAG TPA: DUF4908 domain-containing protein [Caulobacteraceae bacterium]|nr:DUF4908 domain-containing protein [Caulobacteraceae bacterium]